MRIVVLVRRRGLEPGVSTAADQQLGAAWERERGGVRAALEGIAAFNPEARPMERLPDVHPGRIPRHIAIIMDGNGRWASQRGLARAVGHRRGADAARGTIEEAVRIGVRYVTLYSFSSENWKRPADEVAMLMGLSGEYLLATEELLVRQRVRLVQIGDREGLPGPVRAALERVERVTAGHERATVCLAMNYGSRAEIVAAARALAQDVARGRLEAGAIDEAALASRLQTSAVALPDPDLLVRTGGEMRVSNFLLWQLSYAELYVTETLWPDFDAQALREAIRQYARRDRRFGGLTCPGPGGQA